MRYAYCLNAGDDFNAVIDLAAAAEEAGWDGFFVPDGLALTVPGAGALPLFDPWVVLGAIAARTSRIRLGTFVTPLSRRRPWKVARECVTVDHLSKGRLILSAGLGAATDDAGFHKVGEAMDLKIRAQRLDEALQIIDGIWKGAPFTFTGEHFRVDDVTMAPTPAQKPRIPIWLVGVWPKPKSMRRALAWDGVIPQRYNSYDPLSPDDILQLRAYIAEHRSATTPFDIIAGGSSLVENKRSAEVVRPYADAGVTWWMEGDMAANSVQKCFDRVRKGPPV